MAKAGRKRKAGIKRQPNGQPARIGMEDKAKSTVIAARMRLYVLTQKQADSDLAGYVIGRMVINGVFGRDWSRSVEAVKDYCEATADFMRIKWPNWPIPKAMDYLAGKGTSLSGDPSLKLVSRVEKRYEGLIRKLDRADGIDRMYFHEAAFHDREYGEKSEIAVKACVDILLHA